MTEPLWFRYWPESPDGSFWVEWREVTTTYTRKVYRWGNKLPASVESERETTTATAISQLDNQYYYLLDGHSWRLLSEPNYR